jgi:hypothetical protein
MFKIDEFVKINTEEIKEDIDRGVGRIVEVIPDGPYLSVNFQNPEPENLWLRPSEVVPAPILTRNYANVIECFGMSYEVPSNEGDPNDDPSIIWQKYNDVPDELLEWHEF